MKTPSQSDIDMAHEWCAENIPDSLSEEEFNIKVKEVALEIANDSNLPLYNINIISFHC